MELDNKLAKDIKSYCDLNNLDFNEYVNSLLKKAFLEDKYGTMPSLFKSEPKEEKVEKPKTTRKKRTVKTTEEKEEVKEEQKIVEPITDTEIKLVKKPRATKRTLN